MAAQRQRLWEAGPRLYRAAEGRSQKVRGAHGCQGTNLGGPAVHMGQPFPRSGWITVPQSLPRTLPVKTPSMSHFPEAAMRPTIRPVFSSGSPSKPRFGLNSFITPMAEPKGFHLKFNEMQIFSTLMTHSSRTGVLVRLWSCSECFIQVLKGKSMLRPPVPPLQSRPPSLPSSPSIGSCRAYTTASTNYGLTRLLRQPTTTHPPHPHCRRDIAIAGSVSRPCLAQTRGMGQIQTLGPTGVTTGGVIIKQGPHLQIPLLAQLRDRLGMTPTKLLALGHCASLFGVVALFMKDMLWLRAFLVCGSCCGVLFNLLQPCPLQVPATWGCVFIALNLFQIGVLLHERRLITFKSEEAEVYAAVFQRHGVTPHQFEKLMREAEAAWLDLPAGHTILAEGETVETVSVIVRGCAEVSKDGEAVGEVRPGCLVGETALLGQGHRAGHTVQTTEPSRIVQWPRAKLGSTLACDRGLLLSTAQVINSDLAAKLSNAAAMSNKAKVLETYQDVMLAMLADGMVHPAEKRALREYRQVHRITQAQHLEAVAMCGWTAVEFEDGARLHPTQPHPFSIRHAVENLNRSVVTAGSAAAHHKASTTDASGDLIPQLPSGSQPTGPGGPSNPAAPADHAGGASTHSAESSASA